MLRVTKDYGKDISWNIGSLYAHDSFIWSLIDVLKDLGYENPIKYVFGGIPCKFHGGRIPPRDASERDALDIINMYNKRGVGCRLTFSNTHIDKADLEDSHCNTMLEYLNSKGKDSGNGVIVTLDMLAEYIRGNYSNLQIIASQVKPSVETGLGDDKDTPEYYNSLFDLYDIIVVNPAKVYNTQFLQSLKYPDRVEFIANHRCVPNCNLVKYHYETQDAYSNEVLNGGGNIEDYKITLDKIMEKCRKTKAEYPLAGCSMSQTDIESLVRMGFTQFKVEGRDIDGVSFVRDLGDYVFNSYLFSRISAAILGGAV